MEPLQVIIKLKSPVALSHPWINGDGLIAHLQALKEYGRDYLELVSQSTIKAPIDLDITPPIEYRNGMGCVSISFFDNSNMNTINIYKRYAEKRAHQVKSSRPRKNIRMGSGEFKNEIIKMSYYPAKTVYFFILGDKEGVEDLFYNYMVGLGKKTSAGFGEIKNIDIEVVSEDKSLIHKGKAMRPIPIDKLSEWDRSEYISWKPPYWADENHTECAPPSSEVSF